MKTLRDFYSRSYDEQTWFLRETWCEKCGKPDIGMKNPIEYESNGYIFIEGQCNLCGTVVVSRIEECLK